MIYIVTDKENAYYGKRVQALGIYDTNIYVKFISTGEQILFPLYFNKDQLTHEDKLKFDLI